jgi:hypothetical protein
MATDPDVLTVMAHGREFKVRRVRTGGYEVRSWLKYPAITTYRVSYQGVVLDSTLSVSRARAVADAWGRKLMEFELPARLQAMI